MWAGAVRVTINEREGPRVGEGAIVRSSEDDLPLEGEVSLDALMADLGDRIYESAQPRAYQWDVRGVQGTQGADYGTAHVVVELLGVASEATWAALVTLIVEHIRSTINRDK